MSRADAEQQAAGVERSTGHLHGRVHVSPGHDIFPQPDVAELTIDLATMPSSPSAHTRQGATI